MSKRLIDANALFEEIERVYVDHYEKSAYKFIHDFFNAMRRRIRRSPTVDAVEVVHGEWVEDYETFVQDNGYESEPIQTGYICSECGKDGFPNWHYCPNCGARMLPEPPKGE